jgi:PAS domain S-box-containing protein
LMKNHQEIFKIVIVYAIFGSAWIYFSDTVLSWIVRDPDIITKLSIFKGLLFIVATSVLLCFLIARLSTKIKQSTNALRESEELLSFLVKNSSDILVIIDAEGRQRYASAGAERLSGFPLGELKGRTIDTLIHPDDMKDIRAAWKEVIEHPEKSVTIQYRHIHQNREWVFVEAIAQSFLDEPAINGIIASVRDITERKRVELETEKLQEQLTQAQKMESVGRLAGGVAHDFNNMLGVILGYAEMALEQVAENQPMYSALRGIQQAAQRSADLTKQLLAFARKQTVSPEVLDLNITVASMLTMLNRLIGEDIELTWLPGKNLAPIKMDPSQIDQVLANLCVNARDAIQDTGKITIETDNVFVDETYSDKHAYFVHGEYVLLVVSDNGRGMEVETISHLFEPFFTTKKVGDGTGLGLATVYGIVKQNKGFVNVYSELGQGTTFRIYLPTYAASGRQISEPIGVDSIVCCHETILLVEDEPMILQVTTLMLKSLGYHLLPASTPGEAIRLAQEYAGEIDLLMTDVVMPGMNGRDLAKKLLSLYPNLKQLFMSGYTANVIAQHGVLDEGVNFLQKPFSMEDLAAKIGEVLNQDPPDSHHKYRSEYPDF